jgi:ABC-type branched-subunit amino acid transport system substrate-binding protein
VSTIIAKVKAQNPDSLAWIGASPSDAGLIAKTMVEQGLSIPVTAVAVATFADAIRVGGTAYDELPGVYAPKNRDSSKPAYQDFIKKYVARFGGDEKVVGGKIGDAAAQTYDSIMILTQILAGNDGNTDSDTIATALVAMQPYNGASGCMNCKIDFSKSHNGFENSMIAYRMEKGTPVLAPEIKRD